MEELDDLGIGEPIHASRLYIKAILSPDRAVLTGSCQVLADRPQLHGRREIDLLAEVGARDVLAFEVKATGRPDRGAAKHLLWLRDRLGERFIGGVLLHTGLTVQRLDDRVTAAPIAALWS